MKDIRSRSFKWSLKASVIVLFLKNLRYPVPIFDPQNVVVLTFCSLQSWSIILGLQPRDKAAMLKVNTIAFVFSKREEKCSVLDHHHGRRDASCKPAIERFHSSRGQRLYKFTGTEEIFLQQKVSTHWIGFGKPTWPTYHCFGTIWRMWRHEKTLYRVKIQLS